MFHILIPNTQSYFLDAAEVFCDLYQTSCHVRPQIVTDLPESGDVVVFGTDADSSLIHQMILDKKIPDFSIRYGTDDYQILSIKEQSRSLLFLAAGNKRSQFYAVYDFFERAAGCHYFWDGDVIPSHESIGIEGFNVLEKPHFQYRGLRYFAHRSLMRFQAEHWDFEDWKKEIDWVLKKRLNLAMLRIGIDDLFQKAFPDVVPYPDFKKRPPEAVARSFDDRTLFWSLEYRGELRKKIHEYGRSRGLFQPEDCGTMSHWYSRTPQAFLDKFNPSFVPQTNQNYREQNGLVWDIRNDKNLDLYFKLTQAHVDHYGDGTMFHTIGLAERKCYADQFQNHEMKLYAYRRIVGTLRKHYPHAPLLIASWDFISTWSHDEVKALMKELDPSNTLILDYTSDIGGENNHFMHWNLVGKFPWIFGIFHAFEASNEIRGMYGQIEDRFPVAAQDPMCKGVVFWPENSHQDTLMLEYFPAIAWDPSVYKIDEFIDIFTKKRYVNGNERVMNAIWHDILPAVKACTWGACTDWLGPMREVYPDMYFLLGHKHGSWIFGDLDAKRIEYFIYKCQESQEFLNMVADVFDRLSKFDFNAVDEFTRRDSIDVARTLFSRVMNFAFAKLGIMIDSWCSQHPSGIFSVPFDKDSIQFHLKYMREFGRMFSRLLEASGEFSLNVSLAELQKRHETNPNFEFTLKGNAENNYCRSFIFELAKYCYEPALELYEQFTLKRLENQDKSAWLGLYDTFEKMGRPVIDRFYETPLKDMAPDLQNAFADLPKTLANMAEITRKLK